MMNKKIFENVAYLVSSSLLSKGILFMFYIYVARILGPENYGYITSSTEYIALFLILATFGFQMTVVREVAQNKIRQEDIFNKILPIRLIFAIVALLICLVFCVILYDSTINYNLILILSIMVLFQPFEDHAYSVFWIKQELKYVAFGEIVKISSYILVFIVLNTLYGLKLEHLVYATVIGFLNSIIFKTLKVRSKYNLIFRFDIDIAFARRILKVSMYFGIVSIIYVYSLKVDIQMLNLLSGAVEVGFYSVAWQLIQVGIVFVQALSTALFPNSIKNMKNKEYRSKLLKNISIMTILFCIAACSACFLSKDIVQLLYGDRYESSYILLSILVWYLPMRLFGIWGSQILESGSWYKKRIIIYVCPLLINVVLNYIFIPKYGAIAAAIVALFSNLVLVTSITVSAIFYNLKYYKEVSHV